MTDARIFHVHVMKTGGTSLTRMLHEHFGGERSYPDALDPKARRMQKFAPKVLLDLPVEERAGLRFVSAHMGAWVADEEFPAHLKFTVLRDPVDRTLSHLRQLSLLPQTPDDLEAIYEQPLWKERLVDYQTQIFAASRSEYEEQEAQQRQYDPRQLDGAERGEVLELMQAAFATCIGSPKRIDERSFEDALGRLERVDVVGTTERLDVFVAELSARLGAALPGPSRANVSEDAPVPAGLRERIERDMGWDRRLYEHAASGPRLGS
jgi:hypothetical protein